MTQDERWITRYEEVKDFIEANKRNPSKYVVSVGPGPSDRLLTIVWLKNSISGDCTGRNNIIKNEQTKL